MWFQGLDSIASTNMVMSKKRAPDPTMSENIASYMSDKLESYTSDSYATNPPGTAAMECVQSFILSTLHDNWYTCSKTNHVTHVYYDPGEPVLIFGSPELDKQCEQNANAMWCNRTG